MLLCNSTLTWRVRKAEEREESARRRERELKEEMARRVKEFVDAQGNRPALHDISSDPDWLEVYTELNAVRARDGKHTHKKQDSSKKGKKDKKGTVMNLVLPVPLPDVPAGIKDGKPDGDTSDTLALPAALHLCFPDLFPTMTSARRRPAEETPKSTAAAPRRRATRKQLQHQTGQTQELAAALVIPVEAPASQNSLAWS